MQEEVRAGAKLFTPKPTFAGYGGKKRYRVPAGKLTKKDKEFYAFYKRTLNRKQGFIFELIMAETKCLTINEFCRRTGIDRGNLTRMNQCRYPGSIRYWIKIWRGLRQCQ